MVNLFEGKEDGFLLVYVADNKMKQVILTEDQKEILDICLTLVFKTGKAKITDFTNTVEGGGKSVEPSSEQD